MKVVSASEVGKTAYCPHAHYLSKHTKVSSKTKASFNYGDKQHKSITKLAKEQNGPCFVASYAFGSDHYVTNDLRSFRDNNLLPTLWGRALVRIYYFISPKFIFLLGNSAFAHRVVRSSVSWFHSKVGRGT